MGPIVSKLVEGEKTTWATRNMRWNNTSRIGDSTLSLHNARNGSAPADSGTSASSQSEATQALPKTQDVESPAVVESRRNTPQTQTNTVPVQKKNMSVPNGERTSQRKPKAECETMDRKKVAFFAGLSKKLGPVKHCIDIVFDKVITNFGSAYDSTSGRFTAPIRGTYQFNVTVTNDSAYQADVGVVKNGAGIMNVVANTNIGFVTSSNVAILSLEAGDQVWLQVGAISCFNGEMYTSFSGFLIFDY